MKTKRKNLKATMRLGMVVAVLLASCAHGFHPNFAVHHRGQGTTYRTTKTPMAPFVSYESLKTRHNAGPVGTDKVSLESSAIAHHSAPSDGVLDTVLSFPAVWSLSIMLTLVSLLYAWESFVETVRETLPQTFQPVFEKMWAEVAGLGFIGLFLQVLVHPFEPVLGELSEKYLGEEEILLESFEFLHTAFFQVGIAFFFAAGYQVAVSLKNMDRLNGLEEIGLDPGDGSCTASPSRIAAFMDAPSLPSKATPYTDDEMLSLIPRTTVWEELKLSTEKRNGQSLLIRSYLVEQGSISENTRVKPVMEERFSDLLFELVELSPLTWLPLVPALALANAVDLSHDVVNSSSPNALDSAGFFFSSPEALVPSVVIVSLSVLWGLTNFWKMSEIKSMMLPTTALVEASENGAQAQSVHILPPRFKVPREMKSFTSSPSFVGSVERFFASNEEEESPSTISSLYGEAGGFEFYLSSLRFHTWLCITNIVFFGTQIIPRDIQALVGQSIEMAGDPGSVVPELVTYSSMVVISVALLALSPTTL